MLLHAVTQRMTVHWGWNESDPMHLYHFLSVKWALDDVRRRRLRISLLDQLNDPFELWCVSQEDQRLRVALRDYRIEMSRKYGLICFSKRWRNPLLWSHYADKHRGACLGFDVDPRYVQEIKYVSRRQTLHIPPTAEDSNQLLFTKYRGWRYEEEWRGWFKLDHNERDESGNYFYPFDDSLRLSEIIVGPLCDLAKPEVRDAIGDYRDDVKITKARLAFRTFTIVRNRRGFRQFEERKQT